ncbi:hypothetical protein [Candidatus Uabimicrobium sp. HlEnr_7]|uniref:hypothetical protein n=1 Tax=Candidatus Uabimicrobium helgolandensis TaxID=3095367 RepID=UPI0035588D38
MKDWLVRLRWFKKQSIFSQVVKELPATKIKKFATEAKAYDASMMKDIEPSKRYTLAIVLVDKQMAKVLDDLTLMFIKLVKKVHISAKKALDDYHFQHRERTDKLISMFRDVLSAYKSEKLKERPYVDVDKIIYENIDVVMSQCDEHISYSGNNYFGFLPKFYKGKRSVFFKFLENVKLISFA